MWKSSNQSMVADSTCELVYIAASEASKEMTRLKNFIGVLGVILTTQEAMELFCDNEGVIDLTKELKEHKRSKHNDIKYHYIRNRVRDGHILLKRVSSKDNLANTFTKSLSRVKYNHQIGTLA